MPERIGFIPLKKKEEEQYLSKKVDMLERRVTALENNDGNYQVYLKLKEKFEP